MLGSGSQIAGTKSRWESTARTRASILSVLQASGASPLTLRVGDEHIPAELLERVVHEPRAVHRFDHRPHRLTVLHHAADETAQPVGVRRRRGLGDQLAVIRQQTDVEPTST
jgi:hypothetical protein